MTGCLDAAVFCVKALSQHPSGQLKKIIQTFCKIPVIISFAMAPGSGLILMVTSTLLIL